jgi:hypothetical protein
MLHHNPNAEFCQKRVIRPFPVCLSTMSPRSKNAELFACADRRSCYGTASLTQLCIDPMSQLSRLRATAFLSLAGLLLTPLLAAGLPATVTLSNLEQTYNGSPKLPTGTSDPLGLAISWKFINPAEIDPEPVIQETVYSNMPSTLELSYSSHSFSAQSTFGLANQLKLASTARELTSVDVVMVCWAKAASYPLWSFGNPEGWTHPITSR